MSNNAVARERDFFDLPFYSLRNISCPEDKENNRTILIGKLPIGAIADLPTDENVRDYLLEAEGRQRKRPSQVHLAIKDTLKNNPQNFSVLNGGIVLVARTYEIDEAKKTLKLKSPSIINGSQTQGVIKDYFAECKKANIDAPDAHITFELLVTTDEDLIAETSISRNFQNDVMTLSIAGRLGQLDELDAALRAYNPYVKLQKNETQLSDDYEKTERILQVITALTPTELWLPDTAGETPNKVFAYSAKTRCLKNFQEIYKKAKSSDTDPETVRNKELYKFYLDIVGQAQELHEKWKTHQGFKGTKLIAGFRRATNGDILEVPDGIVFPILAALSAFAHKTPSGWRIIPPKKFKDEELIKAAKTAFMEMAGSNPQNMGKSKSCYTTLYQLTSLYRMLLETEE